MHVVQKGSLVVVLPLLLRAVGGPELVVDCVAPDLGCEAVVEDGGQVCALDRVHTQGEVVCIGLEGVAVLVVEAVLLHGGDELRIGTVPHAVLLNLRAQVET